MKIIDRINGRLKRYICDAIRQSSLQDEICERILVSNYGERQHARTLDDVSGDHVDRYRFASKMIPEGARVLDLACGIGYGTALLSLQNKCYVKGVDISPFAIKHGRRFFASEGVSFEVGDLFEFHDEQIYDLVVSFETLEHIRDEGNAILALRRNLKDGGELIISTPNQNARPFDIVDTPYHVRHYTPDELKDLIEANGFKLIKMYSQPDRENTTVVDGDQGVCLVAHARAEPII